MPVVELDREPVEMREAAAGRRVALLQLLQRQGDVRDGCVDLAGEEVALAVRGEQLGQASPAPREKLEHDEERDDPAVRLREVAEVVVSRHLAAEERVLLAHAVLDEGVADTA